MDVHVKPIPIPITIATTSSFSASHSYLYPAAGTLFPQSSASFSSQYYTKPTYYINTMSTGRLLSPGLPLLHHPGLGHQSTPTTTHLNFIEYAREKDTKSNHFKCPHCVMEQQLSKKRQRHTTGSRSQCRDFGALMDHINAFHLDDYERMKILNKSDRYQCFEPFCGWVFRDVKDLVEHTIMNHPETFGLRYEPSDHNMSGLSQNEITAPLNGRNIQTAIIPHKLETFYKTNSLNDNENT